MTYMAEISRSNPTCFLFLVDQSKSMLRPFAANSDRTMAQGVADALNRLVHTLVSRCAKGDYILDRYSIGVVGYGAEVSLGFAGDLAGDVLRPVSEIGSHPLRIEERERLVEDGAGGLIKQATRFPVWFEPKGEGRTPMCQALQIARDVIGNFIAEHSACFPPIVINITDGMANDGHPHKPARELCELASQDGNVLLMNIHISPNGTTPILLPSTDQGLPDDFARLLFHMSSPLPGAMLEQAYTLNTPIENGARGFAFNADLSSVIQLLEIGTRVSSNLR